MSVLIEVADAIAGSINAEAFSPAIVAVRSNVAVFDLGEVGTDIAVNVIPTAMTVESESRAKSRFRITTDIGVQRRIDPTNPSQIDALHSLVQQIVDHLRFKTLDTTPAATWSTIEIDPVMASEHFERFNVFTSVITVTHLVTR